MEKIEIILKAFEESIDPLSSGQIAEKTGLEKKEVDKLIKKLKDEEKIHSPKRCYYTIKK